MTDNELDSLLKDKTDFRKRQELIERLRNCESERSVLALKYLAQHDFVYAVRIAAWQELEAKGIMFPKPVERQRHVILLERFLEQSKRIWQKLADFFIGWGF